MKIRAERKVLAETAHWVAQAIPKTFSVPALAGIRLVAADERLTLSAFDYDVSHEARIHAEVTTPGEVLISGAFLRTIVAAMPGDHVELIVEEGVLTVRAGRSTYRAQALDLADYPSLPEVPSPVGTVDADELAAAVVACSPPVDDAAPTEGLRGMRLEADGSLEVVGLTSALIIHRSLAWDGEAFAATVSSSSIGGATKGLVGPVTVGRSESSISLTDSERTVVLRTLQGTFADWARIPRPADQDRFSVVTDRDELAGAVKRASLLTRSEREVPMVSLDIEHDAIDVTSSASNNQASEVIEAEGDGRELLPLNPQLITDALAAMPPGSVRLGIGARRQPDMGAFLTIRPADGSTNSEAVVAARRGGEAR